MKKVFFLLLLTCWLVKADPGMFLPIELEEKKLIQKWNKEKIKLQASDFYHPQKTSFKEAIVHFGGFCSGSFVSNQGLLITNHHCGYEGIQKVSTVEKNYLKNGFVAASLEEEIPVPDLFVRVLQKMEDVTDKILAGIEKNPSGEEFDKRMQNNKKQLLASWKEKIDQEHLFVEIKDFDAQTKFVLMVYQQFNDVRLVAAPGEDLGAFGGDTDNWVWPRHTADFSMFRVYVNVDQSPASSGKGTTAYLPQGFFRMAKGNITTNQTSFILGFPGSTQRHFTAQQLEFLLKHQLPKRLEFVEKQIEILKNEMQDEKSKLKWASRLQSLENFYKNGKEKLIASEKNKVLEAKKELEKQQIAFAKQQGFEKVEGVFERENWNAEKLLQQTLLQEFLSHPFYFPSFFKELAQKSKDKDTASLLDLIEKSKNFYKNWDLNMHQKIAVLLLEQIDKDQKQNFGLLIEEILHRSYKKEQLDKVLLGKNWRVAVEKSIFAKENSAAAVLESKNWALIEKDPWFESYVFIKDYFEKSQKELLDYEKNKNLFAILRSYEKEGFFSDANSTLRISFGKTMGYSPKDAVFYQDFTSLNGILEKNQTGDPVYLLTDDFKNKLIEKNKSTNSSKLKVNFLTNHDSTGGNSGSATLNEKGELIGLLFDGTMDGRTGDFWIFPELQRSIHVSTDFILFILETFDAKRILSEIQIIDYDQK